MSFTISKQTGLNKDYYGYDTEYSIDFSFQKQKANVTIAIYSEHPNKIHLSSNTDGYHWLQFFLSNEPDTAKLLEHDYKTEVEKCQALFAPFNITYEQEDKETAWLTYQYKYVESEVIKIIAELIEPRFANREKFFNN